ncbi:MAG TPA: hypothetical protein VGB53_03425 [Rubricoccaceae bacterium]|jgi:hypothetical protein
MRFVALVFVLSCATLPARTAHAQTAPAPGACQLGTASALLDIGDVTARVFNTGSLFYGNGFQAAYEVPRGKTPIFAAGLWVAGVVGGEVRASGGTYGTPGADFTLWPGPLGPDARPVNPTDCSAFDRIYTVSRLDIARYYQTGTATADLRDWPFALGAMVLDGDGDPSNYDLAGGDQPAIRGDQTAWSLTNDVGNVHAQLRTPPLGIEVRTEASAFGLGRLSETTVYRYTFTNRTAATIDSVYAGMFVDADLGDASDDYIGADSLRSMAYTYNADNLDGTGTGGTYGATPPAIGVQILDGPVGLPNGRDDDGDGATDEPGERLRATAAPRDGGTARRRHRATAAPLICKNPTVCDEPASGREMLRKLMGLLNDGSPVRAYSDGVQETRGAVTRYAYSGDPVTRTGWTELTPGGPSNAPSDRRMMVATGPFRLAPGQSETVTFAIPYGRGTSNLNSVTELRRTATAVSSALAAGYFEPQRTGEIAPQPVDQAVRLGGPSPNPFTGRAVVRYAMPAGTRLRATLLDVLGREIAVLADGPTLAAEGEIAVDGAGLAPGVYRVRVVVPGAERFVTLVHTR